MKPKLWNENTVCKRCGERLIISGGNWTGKWICKKCYLKDYNHSSESHQNIIKRLRDRRIRNLDPNSMQAKGDIFEEITCKWRGVKNLNVVNDNFNSPIDHSRDPELGIIQTKGAVLNFHYGKERWDYSVVNEHGKKFDYLILYCMSYDEKHIERVYVIPCIEIMIRTHITMFKNSTNNTWYYEYRIDETDADNVYQKIKKIKMLKIHEFIRFGDVGSIVKS